MLLDKVVMGVAKRFQRTPVHVVPPVVVYREYRDAGRTLVGVRVTVRYAECGIVEHWFTSDEDNLCIVSADKAHENAIAFYQKVASRLYRQR